MGISMSEMEILQEQVNYQDPMNSKKYMVSQWKGDPIPVKVYDSLLLDNGKTITYTVGTIDIEDNDLIHVDYGRSFMTSTRSGVGPQSEFPNGKISLIGIDYNISKVLNSDENANINRIELTEEEIKALTQATNLRIKNRLDELRPQAIEDAKQREEKAELLREQAKQNRDEKVKDTISKMNNFFGKKSVLK